MDLAREANEVAWIRREMAMNSLFPGIALELIPKIRLAAPARGCCLYHGFLLGRGATVAVSL
jgi:hypothetical protein